MEKTSIIELLKYFIREYESTDINQSTIFIKYTNKNNPEEYYVDLTVDEIFEKGINQNEFTREEIEANNKGSLSVHLTGKSYITSNDVEVLEKVVSYAKILVYDYNKEYAKLSNKKTRLSKNKEINKSGIEKIDKDILILKKLFGKTIKEKLSK